MNEGEGRNVTVRRGTKLHDAARQLPASVKEQRRIRFEVLERGAGDIGQSKASECVARAISGPGIELDGPHQGQMNLKAAHGGILRISSSDVIRLNRSGVVSIASALDGRVIETGETAAVVKAPHLFERQRVVERALAGNRSRPIIDIHPFVHRHAVLIAGTRIRARNLTISSGLMGEELGRFEASLVDIRHLEQDDPELIAQTYQEVLNEGAELILVAGTIMLDPRDPYIVAVKQVGGEVLQEGAPVDPGTMFWLAYLPGAPGMVPLFGLASCELYGRTSILDLLLPYALADQMITPELLAELGYGGLLVETQAARRPPGWQR